MKVIIFAGGLGTRLGSITADMPKPMVKIGDKPILWHIMKIYSHFKLRDFILCLGYKQEVIKDYFHNYSVYANDHTLQVGSKKIKYHGTHDENHWKITFADTGENTEKGGRLKRLEKYLDDDINLLTYGDGVGDIDINKLIKFHKSHGKIFTLTGVRPPERFGELIEKDAHLISFQEKPEKSKRYINGGFFVFDKRLLKYLTADEKCDLEYGTFDKLVKDKQIMVYKHNGKWDCIDTERDMRLMNKMWNEGKAFWKMWD